MLDTRFATVADIPLIQELTEKIWPHTYAGILDAEQISYMLEKFYSTGALQTQMRREAHEFMILYKDSEPVAFASYGMPEARKCRLHKLYLLPSLQGKGVGRKFLKLITDHIQERGIEELLLNVNRYNPALSFYKKLGFKIAGEEDIDIGGGYFMNDYIMSLELR